MIMRYASFVCVAALFPGVVLCADASALECLLPTPARVSPREGSADAVAQTRIEFRTGEVGAPAAVRAESYRIEIRPRGITVTAPTEKGRNWARTTLAQLKALGGEKDLPCADISDWPEMKWRGLLLDCGRNYVSLPLIRQTIDFLSRYKCNVFHWHLSDYHGWRLESRIHPELQRPQAFTRQVGRYYTQAEFKEIVAYAAARGVTIVPELDVPGHSAAFRRAFGFKTMCDEGARERVCELIDELCSLADAETMPVVHLGTDEVRNPEEKVPDEYYDVWARRVAAHGRTVMGWWPGHVLRCGGKVLQQTWWETRPPTGPFVDAGCCYIDSFSPWSLLAQASFKKVGGWYDVDPTWRVGGEVEAWHDDPVLESADVARDNPLFPAILLFSDMLWRGNGTHATNLVFAPPPVGREGFARMADLERRALAQRDRVLADFPHPLQIVRQTQMKWTMSDEQGNVIARNLPCGTVYVRSARHEWGYPGHVASPTGTVVLTTSFVSPRAREAGAFIELNEYHRSGGRRYGLPAAGQWNRHGATVELNGQKIQPPDWNHPGASGNALDDVPWTDECAWIRRPTPIRLEKGLNRVRIVLPKRDANWYWSASFLPVEGTRDHPREIADLEFCEAR